MRGEVGGLMSAGAIASTSNRTTWDMLELVRGKIVSHECTRVHRALTGFHTVLRNAQWGFASELAWPAGQRRR